MRIRLFLISLFISFDVLAGVFIQKNGQITAITTGNSGSPASEVFSIKVSRVSVNVMREIGLRFQNQTSETIYMGISQHIR